MNYFKSDLKDIKKLKYTLSFFSKDEKELEQLKKENKELKINFEDLMLQNLIEDLDMTSFDTSYMRIRDYLEEDNIFKAVVEFFRASDAKATKKLYDKYGFDRLARAIKILWGVDCHDN